MSQFHSIKVERGEFLRDSVGVYESCDLTNGMKWIACWIRIDETSFLYEKDAVDYGEKKAKELGIECENLIQTKKKKK